MPPAEAETQNAEAAPDAGLGYVPPRVIQFGWLGEAFTLFGARVGLWLGASLAVLAAFALPWVVFYVLENQSDDYSPVGAEFDYLHFLMFGGIWDWMGDDPAFPWRPLIGLGFLSSLLASFPLAAMLRMAVRQVRGQSISARDILRGNPAFVPLWGILLLYGLAAILLLFSYVTFVRTLFGPLAPSGGPWAWSWRWGIGGAVVCLMLLAMLVSLFLPGFALAADGVGARGAWRRSMSAMRPRWFLAAVFVSVLSLIYIGFNFIPFGLGLLIALPVCCLASALAYRDMVGMPGRIFPAPPNYGPPMEGVWPPPPNVTSKVTSE